MGAILLSTVSVDLGKQNKNSVLKFISHNKFFEIGNNLHVDAYGCQLSLQYFIKIASLKSF